MEATEPLVDLFSGQEGAMPSPSDLRLVEAALGPEGFQAWCRGNILQHTLAGARVDLVVAGRWAELASRFPIPERIQLDLSRF